MYRRLRAQASGHADDPASRRHSLAHDAVRHHDAHRAQRAGLPLPVVARPDEGTQFIFDWGLVPAYFSWVAVLTSMFLHGGFLHVGGNMLYLWIFGDNVEDRMGHGRFLAFYLLCGMAAALAQTFVSPASRVPMVGASGAIAGVMGAYFVIYPHSRIVTLHPVLLPPDRRGAGDLLPRHLVPDAVPERRRLDRAGRGGHRRRGVLGARRRASWRACSAGSCSGGPSASGRSGGTTWSGDRDAGEPDGPLYFVPGLSAIFSSRSCARSNDGAISSASSVSASPRPSGRSASSASARSACAAATIGRLGRERAAERAQRQRRVLALQRQPAERRLRLAVERIGGDEAAVGVLGARGVALRLEQRRELARRLDVGVVDLQHRFERADGAVGVLLLLGDRARCRRAGCCAPLAVGSSCAARSNALIAPALSPACAARRPACMCTRKLSGLSAASFFRSSSDGFSLSSGAFSARTMAP